VPGLPRLGGGIQGSIGPFWSWLLGALACSVVLAQTLLARRSRARFEGMAVPWWADALKAALVCAAVLGFVAVVCAYPDPASAADGGATVAGHRRAGVDPAAGRSCSPSWPSARASGALFCHGGNPGPPSFQAADAACCDAVHADGRAGGCGGGDHHLAVEFGHAFDRPDGELYVIAATVIGGTALAGGVGTIPAPSSALLIRAWTTAWC
jgi:D-xylose transport system permease protein